MLVLFDEKDLAETTDEEHFPGERLIVCRNPLLADELARLTITVVMTYKSLAKVERAFRSLKSIDLHIHPIRHWNDDRIRVHVFLCMLAYYVEWHMREAERNAPFSESVRNWFVTLALHTAYMVGKAASLPSRNEDSMFFGKLDKLEAYPTLNPDYSSAAER